MQYNILNKQNVLVRKSDIENILSKFGVEAEINDLAIWQRSFAHASYCVNGGSKKKYQRIINNEELVTCNAEKRLLSEGAIPLQKISNERLEWLGDKILDSIVTKYLFERYPNEDEGFLTTTRSKLVKTESLGARAKDAGLERFILISEYLELGQNGRDNEKNLEDCFEAFIGAMSLDFDDDDRNCRTFVINMLEACVDMTELIQINNNYKDILMRYYQKNFEGKFPKYGDIPLEDGNDKKGFHVYVTNPDGVRLVSAWGNKKKQAQQNAAKKALCMYGVPI